MAKNLHKRLKELQRVAAMHQNQTVAPIGMPVISDTQVAETPAAAVTIGTPEHYKFIRKDLVFVVILMLATVAALIGLTFLVDNTGFAQWIVNLGNSIR